MPPIPPVPRGPLGPHIVPTLLSKVEQEQSSSGNGDHEAIVEGAVLCDGHKSLGLKSFGLIFRRVIWLKNFRPSDHKIKPTPFQLTEKKSTPGNIIMWGICS